MKRTLSLLLAGLILTAGTAYAPKGKAAPAVSPEERYNQALAAVEAAQWPASGDHEKPNVHNRLDVMQAATCLPGNKKQKWSNYAHRCVQTV